MCVSKLDRVGRRTSEVLGLLDLTYIRVVVRRYQRRTASDRYSGGCRAGRGDGHIYADKSRSGGRQGRWDEAANPNGAAAVLKYQATHGNDAGVAGSRTSADQFAGDVWPEVAPLIERSLATGQSPRSSTKLEFQPEGRTVNGMRPQCAELDS